MSLLQRTRVCVSVLTAGIVAAAGLLLASAAPASAHATLTRITPADGAVLTTAPTRVELTFDEAVNPSFATLVVTGPSGEDVTGGAAVVKGSHVSGPLSGGLGSGDYRVAWRVVSDDGHPVSGQSGFRLKLAHEPVATPPAGATSGPASPGAASPGANAGAPGNGSRPLEGSWMTQHLPALSGALLLVVIGAGALVWDRRRH